MRVERFGTTSMTIGITTTRHSDGEVVVSGSEVIVFVDPETLTPVPVPDVIRAAFPPPGSEATVGGGVAEGDGGGQESAVQG